MKNITQKTMQKIIAGVLLVVAGAVFADSMVSTLRTDTPLNEEQKAPKIMPFEDTDKKLKRNYPEQPPVIPHDTEGYRIDLNANKCLSCHARSRTEDSGAPMVSITHFMDREGQFLATISPRRYFCTQCHVSQREVKPLVDNDFVDIDELLHGAQSMEHKSN
jgi:cytochrome c-type protein NapB